MKNTIKILLLNLLFMQIAFSQGWETLYTLPDAVKGATSTASDGYGVHLVGIYNTNVVKHFWVGNDNTIVWSTLAVTGGEMPQVTLYDGILRVTMRVIVTGVHKIRIYQSEDGGYAWTQFTDYEPPGHPAIFNLIAYSDGVGTHITWDNNPNSGHNNFQNEVYYVRYNENPPGFSSFKNVTDLTSPSQGGRPRVAVSGNKACITFLNATNFGRLTSRDLNLDNNTWDSFYRFGVTDLPHLTISEASINDMFYTVGKSDIVVGEDCNQALIFSYRNKNDASWTTGDLWVCTAGQNMRNVLINNEGTLRMINYNPEIGVEALTYDPSTGNWNSEIIEGLTGDQNQESPMLSGGQYGIYYFFDATSPACHQHMRRKALVPVVTGSQTVSVGWNMLGINLARFQLFKSYVFPNNAGVYKYDGGYVAADPLQNNLGYWVQFSSNQTIDKAGSIINSMRMVVKTGWNIIGSITWPVAVSEVTTDPPGILADGKFYVYSGGYVQTNTLWPGLGFWVKTTQNGRIILEGRSEEYNEEEGSEVDSYDKFTVTDNVGFTQDLYVRNAHLVGTTESLEMPPPPPDGEFDSRFSSNDIIRTVDPDSGTVDISIDINAANYPVTITWDLKTENEINYSFIGDSGFGKISDIQLNKGNVNLNGTGKNKFRLFASTNKMNNSNSLPTNYSLMQNYPNPFNPTTRIDFVIIENGFTSLKVYDLLGREVATLVNENLQSGTYYAEFNGSNLPSGIYFYTLTSGNFTATKKLILLK